MWHRRRKFINEADWAAALDVIPMLDMLDDGERIQLRKLSSRFMASKSIEPVRGQRLETADLVVIAAQACLPVLALGLDAYAPWRSVVVYPGGFVGREHRVPGTQNLIPESCHLAVLQSGLHSSEFALTPA